MTTPMVTNAVNRPSSLKMLVMSEMLDIATIINDITPIGVSLQIEIIRVAHAMFLPNNGKGVFQDCKITLSSQKQLCLHRRRLHRENVEVFYNSRKSYSLLYKK